MLCMHMQGSPGLVGAKAGGNIDEEVLLCARVSVRATQECRRESMPGGFRLSHASGRHALGILIPLGVKGLEV